MLKAILFDLDDTLLGSNTENFMAQYFALLGEYSQSIFDNKIFMPSLIESTQRTIKNTDPTMTNADVFWSSFEQMTGGRRDELEPFFSHFYETEFPRLRPITQFRPAAVDVVRTSFEQGLTVVIATNPLFPRTAIEQRLEWAGVPVTDYPYALVTTYEIMHAAKPQPAYYHEILDVIQCPPQQAIMIGDDWKNDIAPASSVGTQTFWIAETDKNTPDSSLIKGQGTLRDLHRYLINGELF